MTEAVVSGAAHAGKEAFHGGLEVLVDYVVPLAAGIGGFVVLPGALGGVNSLTGILYQTPIGNSPNAGRIAYAIMASVSGAIGYVFWRLGHRDGFWMRFIGRAVGAFFLGGAGGYALGIINAKAATSGLIDSLSTQVGSVATGGS